MKLRQDRDSGLLLPKRERVWVPHRDRRLALTGPAFFSSSGSLASALLLKFDTSLTTDNNTTRTNTFGTNGTPTQSATDPKWGSHSLQIDGGTNVHQNLYATGADFRTSTQAFTLQFWFWPISEGSTAGGGVSVLRNAICTLTTGVPSQQNPSSNIQFWWWWTATAGGTFGFQNAGSVTGIASGAWHHFACCGSGSTNKFECWVDGTRFINLSNIANAFNTIYLGNQYVAGLQSDSSAGGYLSKVKFDSVQIITGTTLYTGATITVPTTDFPDL